MWYGEVRFNPALDLLWSVLCRGHSTASPVLVLCIMHISLGNSPMQFQRGSTELVELYEDGVVLDPVVLCAECHHPVDDHSSGVICEEDDMYYFPCQVEGCMCCNDYLAIP